MPSPSLPPFVVDLVNRALVEDGAWDDITTALFVPPDFSAVGRILVKSEGVLSGLDVMAMVFKTIDQGTVFEALAKDGDIVGPGCVVAKATGRASSLLRAERTALNIFQHLSGIATLTYKFVKALEGIPGAPRIADTRKTLPGLRWLEKRAVRHGGGCNHRMTLGDAVLLKDNHRAVIKALGLSLPEAVSSAKRLKPHVYQLAIEADSIEDVKEALEAGADIILLDNMDRGSIVRAVELICGRAVVEVSGGVTLENVRDFAVPGVDVISIGALTHSAPALDVSMEFGI